MIVLGLAVLFSLRASAQYVSFGWTDVAANGPSGRTEAYSHPEGSLLLATTAFRLSCAVKAVKSTLHSVSSIGRGTFATNPTSQVIGDNQFGIRQRVAGILRTASKRAPPRDSIPL